MCSCHNNNLRRAGCGCGCGCNCNCACGCGGNCGCGCGCGGRDRHGECECGHDEGGFKRRFLTRAERVAQLEEYRAELTKELEAVGEAIRALSREG